MCGPAPTLDREAEKRGNSVYFPGRVVPMLPERISNDLCSLRRGRAPPCPRRPHALQRRRQEARPQLPSRDDAFRREALLRAGAGGDRRPARRQDRAAARPGAEAALGGLCSALARARPARAARDRSSGAQGDPEDRRLGRPHRRAAAPRRASADRRVHDPGERRRGRDAGGEDERRSSTASTTSRPSRSSTRCASSSARST